MECFGQMRLRQGWGGAGAPRGMGSRGMGLERLEEWGGAKDARTFNGWREEAEEGRGEGDEVARLGLVPPVMPVVSVFLVRRILLQVGAVSAVTVLAPQGAVGPHGLGRRGWGVGVGA
jgi:hypothetical protein